MEFAILDDTIDVRFASTPEMYILLSYVCATYEETEEEEIGDYIYIYHAYDESKKFCVKIKKSKLKEIEVQWAKICEQKPTIVFVKKENEKYIFDTSGYGQTKIESIFTKEKMVIKSLNFEESDIFKISGDFFNGGFHHIPKEYKNNFELINTYYDEDNVVTADIKFKSDFTVNHSFFPENWSVDYVKKQILKSLKHPFGRKYTEVENKIFSFYGNAEGSITIQTIFNINGEIITAYPLSRRAKQ